MGGGYRGAEGIQPERLNAEGEARVLLAGGVAKRNPRNIVIPMKSVWRTRKQSPRKPIFASFRRIMVVVTIPRVSLRYTPGYKPLASLGLSTFQVVLRSSIAISW